MADYYIPGIGAFDYWDEDHPEHTPGSFTTSSPNPIPFHIGSETLAVHHMCSACQCIVFHLGVGSFYTALRCANCGREWCQHEG